MAAFPVGTLREAAAASVRRTVMTSPFTMLDPRRFPTI